MRTEKTENLEKRATRVGGLKWSGKVGGSSANAVDADSPLEGATPSS